MDRRSHADENLIDAVLIAHHTHRHALKDPLPFDASLREAVERYGAGSPLLGLWLMVRACEGLREEWEAR